MTVTMYTHYGIASCVALACSTPHIFAQAIKQGHCAMAPDAIGFLAPYLNAIGQMCSSPGVQFDRQTSCSLRQPGFTHHLCFPCGVSMWAGQPWHTTSLYLSPSCRPTPGTTQPQP